LLIWGRQDQSTPLAAALKMNEQIDDSKLVIIEHSDHFPFLDNPEQVTLELDNFL
jgi:Predicted hydrolases or acyltransferases (alpha/beta hydrolase superfamily)